MEELQNKIKELEEKLEMEKALLNKEIEALKIKIDEINNVENEAAA